MPSALPHSPTDACDPARPRRERLVALLLLLLLVLVFWYPSGAYPLQALAADAGLLLLTVGAAAAAFRQARGRLLASLGTPPLVLGLAFALWGALRWSFLLVPAPGRTWVVGLLWLGVSLACGAALIAWSGPLGNLLCYLRRGLAVAGLVFAAYAFYQYFILYPASLAVLRGELRGPVADLMTQSQLHALELRRIGGRLGDPNLFACWLAVLAVFGAGCLAPGERAAWRAAGGLSAAACAGALLLTGSRGGLLGLVLGGALAGYSVGRQVWPPRARRAGLMLIGLIGLLAWMEANPAGWAGGPTAAAAEAQAQPEGRSQLEAPAPEEGGWLERLGNIETIRERLYYWQIALRVWQRQPLVGAGPGGFSLLYPTLKPSAARESRYAHNWLFEALSELGLVGAGLLSAFWVLLARRYLRVARMPRGGSLPEALWPLIALAVLCAAGLVQFVMQWREFLILIGVLAGLAGGATRRALSREQFDARTALTWGAGCCVMLLAILMTPRLRAATYYEWRGKDLMQAGDYAAADEAFMRAAELLPDDAGLWVNVAAAKSRTKERSTAWPYLSRAAELNPYSASVCAAQARWLAERGRLVEAIVKLDHAVERYPSNVEYRLERAALLIQAERPEAAREDLRFIAEERLPLWEYQEPTYEALKSARGAP